MAEESTTPDLMKLTRRAGAAASKSDFDALLEFMSPDTVFDASSWGFGTYRGKRAIRSFLEDWIGSFDEYERQVEEMLDLGNGVIYARCLIRGVPSGSRRPIWLTGASVVVWERGVILRLDNHRDRNEGRAAADRLAQERAGGLAGG